MPVSSETGPKSNLKRARSVSVTPDDADTGEVSVSGPRPASKSMRSGSAVADGSRTNGLGPDQHEPVLFPKRPAIEDNAGGFFDSTDTGWDPSKGDFALDPLFQQSGDVVGGTMGMGMGMGMFQSSFDDANEYVDVGPSTTSQTHPRSKNRVTFGQVEDGGLMQDDIAEPEDRAAEDFMQQGGEGPSTAIDRQPYDLNYTSGFW